MSKDGRKKRKKPSYFARMAEHGRDAQYLGRMLRDEPAAMPSEILTRLRRAARTLWQARGGGFYACGFIVTFAWLEVRMFVTEILGADSLGSFVTQQLFEMLFRFLSQSLLNSVLAFIWPVYVIEIRPPWGFALLVSMYLVFAYLLKAPIQRWLFDEEPGAAPDQAGDK